MVCSARLRLAAALALALGCGHEEPPPPRVADRVSILQGDNQTAPAGATLTAPITFQAGDKQGPLAGVVVTFTLADQSGFVSASADTSDANGQVAVLWTVGGLLGTQRLTATAAGAPAATANATVTVGLLALLSPVSNPNQFVVVNRQVASPPAIKATDAFGNAIAGQPIEFSDPTNRSTVVGPSAVTDAQGRAGVTSWRIANEPGPYSIVARTSPGLAASFVAFGIPAAVFAAAGNTQSVNAGTAAPVAPAVEALDDAGAPLPNVPVTFAVTAGGGRLQGAAQTRTGADGIARAAGWIVGPAAGPNELAADIAGLSTVKFTATGVSAVPATAAATTPTAQAGLAGNFGAQRPAVRLTDALGRPVAGAPVTFAITQGNGTLSGATETTDFDGNAAVGSWRFGAGPQAMTATSTALPPVTFTATAQPIPASTYTVEIRFIGPAPSPSQKAAFDSAAARWSRSVVADLENVVFDGSEDFSFCGGQPLTETIDDLVIFAKIDKIDGPGNILGQAGPCYLRDANLLPVAGFMLFDIDDVVGLEASGRFKDVVLHEMGHVLGIGSIWSLQGLLTGRGSEDPYFTGPSARMAFASAALAPGGFSGNAVPVENNGGPGTRDAHWREVVMGNELMTGFLNNGINPLSAVTIASLRDQGYVVDDSGADAYTFAAALRAATESPLELRMAPWNPTVVTVDRHGRVRRRLDRGVGPFLR